MSAGVLIVERMTDIGPLAASTRATFGSPGVHAVVRRGRTVHAVGLGAWVTGEEVWAPDLSPHPISERQKQPQQGAPPPHTRTPCHGAPC